MDFQTGSDYPIAIWQSVKSQFFPRPFGWISKPGLIIELRFDKVSNPNFSPTVWVNSQTGFDYPITIWQVSNPNNSPTVWINFQTASDYPIAIRQSVKIPIFPRPFGKISKSGLIIQLRFDKVSNPNFSTTVWVNFQTGSDYPIAIWQVSNPNFSPIVWINFQTRSDYPIAIWQSVKILIFPDRLDGFPNRVWLPNCDLTKCQIPIFSQTVWMNFQTGSNYQISIWQSVKSQFFPDHLG